MRPLRLLALLLALGAGGCAAPAGDFGRPKPTLLNDNVLPLVGREVARARGEPVSYAMLTDHEKALRARAYRFVMPIHRKGFLAAAEAELVRTRIWPDAFYRVDPSLYYRKQRGEGFVSSEARYNAMVSEIRADTMLIAAFYAEVREVCVADAARLRALGETVALTQHEAADAIGRVYENARVVDWALAALRWRVESYGYALQRNRIEIPSRRDAMVEAALGRLAANVEDLEAAVAALICDGSMAVVGTSQWGPAGAKPLVTKR